MTAGPSDKPVKIFISAGEVSGDLLGGRLLAALKRKLPQGIELRGIGGPAMADQGLQSLFPMSELAVMGLLEILPHIRRLKQRIRQTADAVQEFQPDILITIDAPGFNKRVARLCTDGDYPKLHYVAPTVWAWRPKRVYSFKSLFDNLLCLLPFEPKYFTDVGLDAAFVGHSILEGGADRGQGDRFRADHGISADQRVLCVLPGSRRGEVERLLEIFHQTSERLVKTFPDLHIVMPTVPHLAETVEAAVKNWTVPVTVSVGAERKYDAMAASNAALAASGTVALELAMARVPTVIAYRVNWLTHFILRRMVKVRFAHLLNILADREIVPEAIQDTCRPEYLTGAVEKMFTDAGPTQTAELEPYLAQLAPPGGGSPSEAAAMAVLACIEKKTRGA